MDRSEQQIKIASDHKILLIGQTGAGKTTIVNMMVNIQGGVKYEGERKIAIPQNIKISSYDRKQSKTLFLDCNIGQFKGLQSEVQANQSSSQTQMPSVYKILDKSTNKQLTLIDTPGLSDTEGSKKDEQHINNILSYLISIGGVNTICLVHKASQARLSNSLALAIMNIKEMFTKDCIKNFIVCVTDCSDHSQVSCLDSLEDLGIPLDNIFCFQNDCLKPPAECRNINKGADEAAKKKINKDIRNFSDHWEENTEQFTKLMSISSKLPMIDSRKIKDQHLKKLSCSTIVADQIKHLHNCNTRQSILEDVRQEVANAERELDKYKDHTTMTKVPVMGLVKKDRTEEYWETEYVEDYLQNTISTHNRSGGWWALRILSLGTVFLGEVAVGVAGNLKTGGKKIYVERKVLKKKTITVEVETVIRHDIVQSTDEAKKKAFLSIQKSKENIKLRKTKTEKEIQELQNQIQRSNRIINALQKQISNSTINFNALVTKDSEKLKMTELQEEIETLKIKYKNKPKLMNFYIEEKQSELKFISESARILRSAMNSNGELSQQDIEYLNVIQFEHTNGMNTRLLELKKAIDLQKPWIVNGKDDYVEGESDAVNYEEKVEEKFVEYDLNAIAPGARHIR